MRWRVILGHRLLDILLHPFTGIAIFAMVAGGMVIANAVFDEPRSAEYSACP